MRLSPADPAHGMGVTARETAIRFGLGVMLPDDARTRLLRAALFHGAGGSDALGAAARHLARPQELSPALRVALRTLAPLLEASASASGGGAAVDPETIRLLRVAAARERSRSELVRQLGGRLLGAFAQAGVDAIALRGIPLAETVYPEPHRRHTHDIDLLVRPADVSRAEAAARAAGFTERAADAGRLPDGTRLVHPSGLPVELHTSLFLDGWYPAELEGMRDRTERFMLPGAEGAALGAVDQLIHVCGHASLNPLRGNLRWVSDAWLLLDRGPLDWDRFLRTAESARLALPLSAMMRYLAEQLDSPVPAEVIDRLDRQANSAPAIGRDVALYGARAGLPATALVRNLPGGWRSRLWALGWLLFPSPPYLRHAYRGRGLPLPLLYPYRVWHHAAAGLRDRVRRLRMSRSLEAELA